MKNEAYDALISAALDARKKAYTPYSSFAVGAALLTEGGKIYTGANIESASYTPTVCAERVAFFTALHSGEKRFKKIAIVGGKADSEVSAFCPPCGVCRQVMAEFCTPDFEVITYDGESAKIMTLGEIFPESFNKENLE